MDRRGKSCGYFLFYNSGYFTFSFAHFCLLLIKLIKFGLQGLESTIAYVKRCGMSQKVLPHTTSLESSVVRAEDCKLNEGVKKTLPPHFCSRLNTTMTAILPVKCLFVTKPRLSMDQRGVITLLHPWSFVQAGSICPDGKVTSKCNLTLID